MTKPVYRRVLLKISGEALAGDKHAGLDFQMIGRVCDVVKECLNLGVQVGLVVGGGNFWRGAKDGGGRMERTRADHMGMLATVMNCLAVADVCEQKGIPVRVQTAIEMRPIAEPYIRSRAIRPAGGLVKDLFLDFHGFFRDSGPRRVQTVGPPVGLADVLLQLRRRAFFLGELQAGGRAGVGVGLHLPGLFRRLFHTAALPYLVGTFQHLFGPAGGPGGGEVLFRLPVGDIDFLAGSLIFQHHAVAGHALRHLVTGFQVLPAHAPPSTTSESRVVIILYSSVLLGMGLVKGKITFSKMRSPAPGSELSMYF